MLMELLTVILITCYNYKNSFLFFFNEQTGEQQQLCMLAHANKSVLS